MHIDGEDTDPLKKWVIKRLEDISDADSDVLADYVLALVKSDEPDDVVKQTCLENLEDFLKEHTAVFVDDVFDAIRTKSYLPGYVPPRPSLPTSPSFRAPTGPANSGHEQLATPAYSNGTIGGRGDGSRKRSYTEREGTEARGGRDLHYSRGDGNERSMKQMRRGGDRGRGGRSDSHGGRGGWQPAQHPQQPQLQPQQQGSPVNGRPAFPGLQLPNMPSMPPMPTPPAGFPPLDPTNPLAAVMAMQAMGFPLPGFPPFPQANSPTGLLQPTTPSRDAAVSRKPGERCRDYDTKGFCALGSSCPYEHGSDHIVVPGKAEEYDPKNAMMGIQGMQADTNGHTAPGYTRGGDRGRGRGRGRGERGGFSGGKNGRASFSHAGPNHDRGITSVVVEQIPEEKFDEQSVREFFSEFGNIVEVTMQAYKRLAIVKYDDYYAARRAYDSPKVIFDNRFVKVYWYKPETLPTPPTKGSNGKPGEADPGSEQQDEDMIDPVEFAKKQADAQKAYEEKMKKLKDADAQKEELEKKMRAQAEERKKLLDRLAQKTGGKPSAENPAPATSTAGQEKSPTAETSNDLGFDEQKKKATEALRAKLAALEAEAESMGLPTGDDEYAAGGYGRGRGRGSYRGRGTYAPVGRGYDPYRGSWGRGAFGGWRGRGGAVMRLDNRSKRIAVNGVKWDEGKDEALRAYLLGIGEFDSIEPNSEKNDSVAVSFKERYVAEIFLNAGGDIPGVGKVELSWINTPLPPVSVPQQQKVTQDGDTAMAGAATTGAVADGAKLDVEYDVAEDDDRWMNVS